MTLDVRPLLIAATAVLCLLAGTPANAETVFPRGQRVGLEPLPGMQLEANTNRFLTADGKAGVTIIELPPPAFPDIEKGLFADAKPGVTILKRETFPFATGMGYFIAARVTAPNGAAFRKYVLTSALPNLAFLASFEMAEDAMATYPEETVRKVLASVTVRDPPTEERLGFLPFTMSDLGGFKVSDVVPGGAMLVDPDQPTDLPRVFVSVGQGAPESADERARFAINMIRGAPLTEIKVTSSDPQRIRGMPGYEIKAQGKAPGGAEASLIQWIRFVGTNYIVVFGAARTEEWDRFYGRFRAVRDGVDPR